MAQFLRPASDVSAGPFLPSASGAGLYSLVDESSPDDTDFIYALSAGTVKVALQSGTDPGSSSGHVVRYRAQGNGVNDLRVYLVDTSGPGVVASWVETAAAATVTAYSHTLSGAEADLIADYTALELWFSLVATVPLITVVGTGAVGTLVPSTGGADIALIDSSELVDATDGSGNITSNPVDVSGTNRIVYVWVTQDTAGDPGTPTCSFNSQSMTLVTEDNTDGQWQAMFRLIAPNTGTGLTAVLGGLVSGFDTTVAVRVYENVDQTTPDGTVDITSTTGATSLSSGTVTCAAGNWVVGHLALGDGADTVTCTNASEAVTTLGSSASGYGAAVCEDHVGSDLVMNFSWTTPSQRASLMSFELKKA